VEHVAVVVDLTDLEALAALHEPGGLEQPVSFAAELVGPRERAARREGSEAVEVAGQEQALEPSPPHLRRAARPPQLEQLGAVRNLCRCTASITWRSRGWTASGTSSSRRPRATTAPS